MMLLAVTGVGVALVWLGMWAVPALRWPRELVLPRGDDARCARCAQSPPGGSARSGGRRGAAGRVVALVPARDEAAMLPLTLPALLAQSGLDAVVLVDDGSRDGTAEVARRIAAEKAPSATRASLEVLRLGEVESDAPADGRPEGWSGKVWAQARGLARARELWGDVEGSAAVEVAVEVAVEAVDAAVDAALDGAVDRVDPAEETIAESNPPAIEWLLLVDADIRLRPGALRDLLAVAAVEDRDLVSVMARLRTRSPWERLLVPPFVYFFQLLYPFRRVRDDRSRVAAAAGGCVLVRRAALERAGGFEAIRDRLIDDVALGQGVKRTGGRLWLGFDQGIESVRPYDTLAELWRMIARNAFVQLGFRWSLLLGTLLGLGVVFVLPPFGLAAALWRGWAGGGAATTDAAVELQATVAAAGFAVAWLLQVTALWPSVRHHRAGWLFAWTLPLAAVLYGAMTFSSAWAHLRGRTSRWRGRVYRRTGEATSDD
jgi:hopene-associated glycosyltransferase HpnB